jgi:hypothetical protein
VNLLDDRTLYLLESLETDWIRESVSPIMGIIQGKMTGLWLSRHGRFTFEPTHNPNVIVDHLANLIWEKWFEIEPLAISGSISRHSTRYESIMQFSLELEHRLSITRGSFPDVIESRMFVGWIGCLIVL